MRTKYIFDLPGMIPVMNCGFIFLSTLALTPTESANSVIVKSSSTLKHHSSSRRNGIPCMPNSFPKEYA